MDEDQIRREVLSTLRPSFNIRKEVPGKHFTGQKFRLDAVVTPRHPQRWKNSDVALGIEFKDVMRLSGDTKNFTKSMAQCFDYSNTYWEDFGYLHIFVCPSLIKQVPKGKSECEAQVEGTLTRVMGQMGIGELKHWDWKGWAFTLHSGHRLWSEKKGVEEGKHWNLEREFGSR